MQFITVKSSHYQTDLVVLQSRLESEGIECLLKNELTAQVINYLPAFEVELQVPESDLPRVKEIMIKNGEWENKQQKPACTNCGSEKISLKLSFAKRVKLFLAIFYVLFGANVPMDKLFKKAKFRCSECREEFY